MKRSTIWVSENPVACIFAMRSFAGLENEHSSMLQVDTESLHPHWHCIRAPTRRTSAVGFSETVCPSAAAASRATSRLPLNRRMCLGNPHHFGAGILHLDLARHQADQRAADEHQAAHPDPRNQRKDIGLNDAALVIVRHTGEVEVQVFVRPLPDAYLRR